MKKFLLLLICIAMTFTLVGCGNTNTGNEEGKTTLCRRSHCWLQ